VHPTIQLQYAKKLNMTAIGIPLSPGDDKQKYFSKIEEMRKYNPNELFENLPNFDAPFIKYREPGYDYDQLTARGNAHTNWQTIAHCITKRKDR
jgi:hypothetical protein